MGGHHTPTETQGAMRDGKHIPPLEMKTEWQKRTGGGFFFGDFRADIERGGGRNGNHVPCEGGLEAGGSGKTQFLLGGSFRWHFPALLFVLFWVRRLFFFFITCT